MLVQRRVRPDQNFVAGKEDVVSQQTVTSVLGVPTLLLAGGESPAALRKAGEAVDEAPPDSRIFVMPGQGHAAVGRTDASYA